MATHGAGRLRVYQLAVVFGDQIDELLRRNRYRSSLADQMRRAADSVLLNIAEGAAHFTPGRKAFHYRIAHGSAAEAIAALRRLTGPRPGPAAERARRNGEMICVMLVSLLRALDQRPPTPR